MQRRLGLLGRVNLLASGELESLQERHDFLARELDDVKKARRDLLEVIRRIEDEIVETFAAAYRDVAAARALGYADLVAPPTFAIVIALEASVDVVKDPDFGLDYSRVVHGEQRFAYTRPVVAGDELVVTTPARDGVVPPLVLAACEVAGVDRIFRIGGAQAIAALAYGAGRIAPVDVVTGPGNAWVAEAKRQVYGVVGIDMVAGPSEIVVVADGANDPDWIAADLLAQAEHDEAAQSILITDDPALAVSIAQAVCSAALTRVV